MPHLARERVRRRTLGLEGNLGEGRECFLGFAIVDRVNPSLTLLARRIQNETIGVLDNPG